MPPLPAATAGCVPQGMREPPGGRQPIEVMRFDMSGWRKMRLAIDGPALTDRVGFETLLAEPGAGR
ncbi:MAG: hypothetical protein JNL87_07990 [Burkholderiaceae bacterium]|nr:hypothetical protein [Burkholderiaceae bacterium]